MTEIKPKMPKKTTKEKKNEPKVIEIHIYVHQESAWTYVPASTVQKRANVFDPLPDGWVTYC